MIKNFLLLLSFTLCLFFANAQKNNQKNAAILAVNAEQMLNKAGFENLLDLIFNEKNPDKEDDAVNKTKIRKSIAAIYGAGIDFDKKIWFVANNKESKTANKYSLINPFNNFDASIYIPIANMQIIENAINDLRGDVPFKWQEKFGTKYVAEENYVIALNDKVMALFFNPNFDYRNYDKYRIVIKRDTIKEELFKKEVEDVSFNDKKADPNFVVDRVDAQGNVIRDEKFSKKVLLAKNKYNNYEDVVMAAADSVSYTKVEIAKPTANASTKKVAKGNNKVHTKKKSNTAGKVQKGQVSSEVGYELPPPPPPPPPGIAVYNDRKEVIREPMVIKMDTVKSAKYTKVNKFKNKRDTITDYDYLDINTKVKITYFNCTDKERDSIDVVIEKEKELAKSLFADEKLLSLKEPLPFDETNSNDIKQMQESKSDMYLYVTGKLFNGLSSPAMYGFANIATPAMDNSSFTNTLDFETGKIVLQSSTNYDTEILKLFSNFYFPLNNNWPANFGNKSKGQMQVNLNITKMLDYYKGLFSTWGRVNVFKEMETKGFKAEEISQAFTGEFYGFVDTKESTSSYKKESGREEMFGGVAIGVKDAKVAVALLNKMASLENDMPQFYAFDKTGKYLVFYGSMNNKFFAEDMANIIDSKSVDKEMISLSGNDFGRVQFNLKAFIKAMNGKDNDMGKTFNYFIERLNMITFGMNRIEDGNYKSILTMDCGETKQNPLAMFVEMARLGMQEEKERQEIYRTEREEQQKKEAAKKRPATSRSTKKTIKK